MRSIFAIVIATACGLAVFLPSQAMAGKKGLAEDGAAARTKAGTERIRTTSSRDTTGSGGAGTAKISGKKPYGWIQPSFDKGR
jgi:hypothetical protein